MHPVDPQVNIPAASAEESKAYSYIPQFQCQMTSIAELDRFITSDMAKFSAVKSLKDMLKQSQSSTPMSSGSCVSDFIVEDDFEVIVKERKHDTERYLCISLTICTLDIDKIILFN